MANSYLKYERRGRASTPFLRRFGSLLQTGVEADQRPGRDHRDLQPGQPEGGLLGQDAGQLLGRGRVQPGPGHLPEEAQIRRSAAGKGNPGSIL